MKLRQLQCLCAVVDAGFNISRAANNLHATQPAVGKQLRQLEHELDVEVLVRREGRVVGLTEPGERIVAWARHAMQSAQNIRAVARESGDGAGGSIVITTSHAHAMHVLLPAVTAFTRRFPKVHITVLQGALDQVGDLVQQGAATLGVAHLPPMLPKNVLAVPFLTTHRVLVMPTGHPLLKEKTLTLEKISAFPLIIQHSIRPEGARIVRRFQEAGLDVNVVVYALDSDVIKAYVGAGLGIGVIPAFSHTPEKDRGLRVRDAGHLFDDSVSVVLLRRRSHLPRYVYAFLESLDASLDQHRLDSLIFQEMPGDR
jgi:LysR family cys regulon transcriptional activator